MEAIADLVHARTNQSLFRPAGNECDRDVLMLLSYCVAKVTAV